MAVEKFLTKEQSYDLWCKEFAAYEEGISSGIYKNNGPKLDINSTSTLKRKTLDQDVIPLCWTSKEKTEGPSASQAS